MSYPVEHCTQLDDIAVAIQVDSSPTRSEENVEVDVPKGFLATTLESMASAAPTRRDYTRTPATIYKVPMELKRGDEDEGYEPVAVRIGPFTRKTSSTAQLEKYKWCCVRQLMKDDPPGLLKNCLESMKRVEPEIRASYSQEIGGDSDGLALNMVLDGCFILHCLLKYARQSEREEGIIDQDEGEDGDCDWTQVFGRVKVWHFVKIDLVLLENQIPFFVLSKLFELLCARGRDDDPMDALVKGSLGLFRSLCPHMLQRSAAEIDYHGVHHLLHLLYLSVMGRSPSPTPEPWLGESESDNIKRSSNQAADVLVLDPPQWIPCAKELEELGMKFFSKQMRRVAINPFIYLLIRDKEAESFLDIQFPGVCMLVIPPLQLYDFSDKLFRNLIAFEQVYPGTRCDITTYAVFMDCLIKTPEDMRIVHQISGEQDASRFFSRICAQVRWRTADENHLKDVMDKVNHFRVRVSKRPLWEWEKLRLLLIRNYCSNPWMAMSVLAAVLLLGLTILQTFFTVYPYFKPSKLK